MCVSRDGVMRFGVTHPLLRLFFLFKVPKQCCTGECRAGVSSFIHSRGEIADRCHVAFRTLPWLHRENVIVHAER